MVYYAYFGAMEDIYRFKCIDGCPFRLFLSGIMHTLATDTKGHKEEKTEDALKLFTLAIEWREPLEAAILEFEDRRGMLKCLHSPLWLLWWRPQQ